VRLVEPEDLASLVDPDDSPDPKPKRTVKRTTRTTRKEK
jgi:hypothetical protein